jgi:Fic family protein
MRRLQITAVRLAFLMMFSSFSRSENFMAKGSTFTEPETEAVLFQNVTIPNRSLIEHLEVKNHQTALQYLLNHMEPGPGNIDEALVLSMHRILMNSIRPDAGTYRQHSVRIVGADVPTANYLKVPGLMVRLLERM